MAFDIDANVLIESGGNTFNVATDAVYFSGATSHFQYMKLAYGPTGSISLVSSSNPFPVNVVAGGITANLIGFCGAVQGIAGGTPVAVSGTVYATGVTSSPVYVRTYSGYQVEITGGIPLSKTNSSVSVWGPNGNTWSYTNMVDSSGVLVGSSTNPLYTIISGATIAVTVNPTVGVTNDSPGNGLRIQGMSGGTVVTVGVSGSVNINDTAILNGMTALGNTLTAIYNALSVFGLVRPTSAASGLLNVTTGATLINSGFTCYAGVNLKALGSNTDLIYIGNSSVGTSYGYQLEPGENVFLNVGNANNIYAMSKSGTQILSYFAS